MDKLYFSVSMDRGYEGLEWAVAGKDNNLLALSDGAGRWYKVAPEWGVHILECYIAGVEEPMGTPRMLEKGQGVLYAQSVGRGFLTEWEFFFGVEECGAPHFIEDYEACASLTFSPCFRLKQAEKEIALESMDSFSVAYVDHSPTAALMSA